MLYKKLKYQNIPEHAIGSSACFENPSVHSQEDMVIQFYGISFMLPYNQSGRWQDVLIWMYKRYAIKLHVRVSLRMNTWMFETY